MILDDLIDLLQRHKENYGGNIEVSYVSSFTQHNCNADDYCYCMTEDHLFSINQIDKQTKFDKKKKSQEVIGLTLRGEKNI